VAALIEASGRSEKNPERRPKCQQMLLATGLRHEHTLLNHISFRVTKAAHDKGSSLIVRTILDTQTKKNVSQSSTNIYMQNTHKQRVPESTLELYCRARMPGVGKQETWETNRKGCMLKTFYLDQSRGRWTVLANRRKTTQTTCTIYLYGQPKLDRRIGGRGGMVACVSQPLNSLRFCIRFTRVLL